MKFYALLLGGLLTSAGAYATLPMSINTDTQHFALQDPSPRLLGTWQCQTNYQDSDTHIKSDFRMEFLGDGVLNVHKISTSTESDGSSSTYKINTKRYWQTALSESDNLWVLIEQIIEATHFEVDNPTLEDKHQLQAFIAKQPTYESVPIFSTKDGKDTLKLINGFGAVLADCTKAH